MSDQQPRNPPFLQLVTELDEDGALPAPAPPASMSQLVLPGLEGVCQPGLILSSFRNLLCLGIEHALTRYKPGLIVDVRSTPTFAPFRGKISVFVAELQALGIEYWHVEQLAPNIRGRGAQTEEYIQQLRAHAEVLKRVAQRALSTTVLLISADPRTRGSDREIIAAELSRMIDKRRALEIIAV